VNAIGHGGEQPVAGKALRYAEYAVEANQHSRQDGYQLPKKILVHKKTELTN
jgi:hypothetical protein